MRTLLRASIAVVLLLLSGGIASAQTALPKPAELNSGPVASTRVVQSPSANPESMKMTGLLLMVAGGVLAVPAVMNWSDYSSTADAVSGWDNYFFRRAVGWSIASGTMFGVGMWSYSKGASQASSRSLLQVTDQGTRLSIPMVSVRSKSLKVSSLSLVSAEIYMPLLRFER